MASYSHTWARASLSVTFCVRATCVRFCLESNPSYKLTLLMMYAVEYTLLLSKPELISTEWETLRVDGSLLLLYKELIQITQTLEFVFPVVGSHLVNEMSLQLNDDELYVVTQEDWFYSNSTLVRITSFWWREASTCCCSRVTAIWCSWSCWRTYSEYLFHQNTVASTAFTLCCRDAIFETESVSC